MSNDAASSEITKELRSRQYIIRTSIPRPSVRSTTTVKQRAAATGQREAIIARHRGLQTEPRTVLGRHDRSLSPTGTVTPRAALVPTAPSVGLDSEAPTTPSRARSLPPVPIVKFSATPVTHTVRAPIRATQTDLVTMQTNDGNDDSAGTFKTDTR